MSLWLAEKSLGETQVGWDLSLGGDEDQALDEDESSVASVIPVGYSTNSSTERTCPRCLGHNFVWFEELHVEDRSVEVVLGGAG